MNLFKTIGFYDMEASQDGEGAKLPCNFPKHHPACLSLAEIKCPSLLLQALCTDHCCASILKEKKTKSNKALASGTPVHSWVSGFKLLRNLHQHYVLQEKAETNPRHVIIAPWSLGRGEEGGMEGGRNSENVGWKWCHVVLGYIIISSVFSTVKPIQNHKARSDPGHLV